MKVTCRSNGSVQIFLEPETDIERAYVQTMVAQAGKGQQPKIEPLPAAPENGMVITMRES